MVEYCLDITAKVVLFLLVSSTALHAWIGCDPLFLLMHTFCSCTR